MELEERVTQLKEQNLEPKEIARTILKEAPDIDLHLFADAVGITFPEARGIKGALVRIKELPAPGRGGTRQKANQAPDCMRHSTALA